MTKDPEPTAIPTKDISTNDPEPTATPTKDISTNDPEPTAIPTKDISTNDPEPTAIPTKDILTKDPETTATPTIDILTDGGKTGEFVYTSMTDAGDIITNFQVGPDKLVFTKLLDTLNYTGTDALKDEYIRLVSGGTGTILEIDPDGPIGSGVFRPFLLVENVKPEDLNKVNNFLF
ncbi:MAG: hypothetical protein MUE44_29185 [Oscillatoriaceae cyanobacterium Prado104]|nr:hypothetical protein [Oscillatoriaceae cyanobacterium Prado104]